MNPKEKIIFGFIISDKPVENLFDYVLSHNIRHIEFDLKKKPFLLKTFTPERIAYFREFSEKNRVSLSLHPPYDINLCSSSMAVRFFQVSYLKKSILLAHRLKATHITLHIGSFQRSSWYNPRHHALEYLCKSLRKVLPICEFYKVPLALENVVPMPPQTGFSFLGDNIGDFETIYSTVESDYLKFCLDIGHANTNEGPLEYVEKLGKKIINVHFHDNMGRRDEHLDVGKGTVDWGALIAALVKLGFYGPYVSECFQSLPHVAKEQLENYFLPFYTD